MKSIFGMAALAAALWLSAAGDAWGQCRGGGGGGSPQSAGGAPIGLASSGGGELLTGPGSWAYDMMVQQAMLQAYWQQRMALAAQQAEKDAAKKAARQATHQQRRQSELARRAQYRSLAAD